ncbi:hypothetical protein [Chitinophaga nivalis]|uniref:Uncharacterized protein n=1 Tax=Chitinophaga nivalis TaxID=2991709 RepID=A0ABT3IWK1_9BACT|nr:hypothetical protein [Chitinophaga nivalis]MCW3461976.1 hypothetical protein [Chitinophaga nivalis]MCW3488333.1 hypothetical protein [Chitinophaga nivalis]
MSNSTLTVFSNLCLVTNNDLTTHMDMDEIALSEEEQAVFEDTRAALNQVRYFPRAATLQQIFDYAAAKQEHK